ncbi:recombinase family protein [Amycolatopsis sp. NPDC003731]
MTSEEREPWYLYLRKSYVANDKDAESIEVQRTNDTKYVESQGGYVAGEFVDEGISASKGLERPDFLRMLRGIDDGTVKRLCVRDQARISREEEELFVFLKRIEKAGTLVRDSYGREIKNDLQSKIKGIFDSEYARTVGKLVAEKKAYNAAQGIPPKARNRPYGWTKGYAKVIPEEAQNLKDARKQIVAGVSAYAIIKDWRERGILTSNGKTWKTQDLTRILRKPELAGLKTYHGEVVGKGQWDAIFTKDEHEEVVKALSGNVAYSTSTARKHLLTGILICGLCKSKLSAKWPSYWCNPSRGGCGKIVRNMKALDEYFTRRVYEYIKKLPKVSEEPAKDPIGERIAELQKDRDEYVEARKEKLISLKDFLAFTQPIDAELKELQRKKPVNVALPVDDAQSFLDASIDKQRATIARIYPIVEVNPTGRKGARFHPDQLDF